MQTFQQYHKDCKKDRQAMKTRSEMLDDAQRARNPYITSDQKAKMDALMAASKAQNPGDSQDTQDVADCLAAANAAFAADSQSKLSEALGKVAKATMLCDLIERPILIPAGTFVYVADKSRTLMAHKLKKDHVFMSYLVGCEPEFVTGAADPDIAAITSPAELMKVDYYTFETGNPDWPHIIVQRDRLTTK